MTSIIVKERRSDIGPSPLTNGRNAPKVRLFPTRSTRFLRRKRAFLQCWNFPPGADRRAARAAFFDNNRYEARSSN
jgi:hypothetical protein